VAGFALSQALVAVGAATAFAAAAPTIIVITKLIKKGRANH
jgi:hypothetical protein